MDFKQLVVVCPRDQLAELEPFFGLEAEVWRAHVAVVASEDVEPWEVVLASRERGFLTVLVQDATAFTIKITARAFGVDFGVFMPRDGDGPMLPADVVVLPGPLRSLSQETKVFARGVLAGGLCRFGIETLPPLP